MPAETEDPKKPSASSGTAPDGDDDGEVRRDNLVGGEDEDHDPYYPPIIVLPEVLVASGEEDEEEAFPRTRAKLFRYDSGDGSEDNPAQWKERGTGECKLLRHLETGAVRFVMRRDKTLKICANHNVQPWMELKPNCGSDRAFVWRVQADFADGEANSELLAIRFANAENASKFRAAFESAAKEMGELQSKKEKTKATEEKKESAAAEKEIADDLEKKAVIADK